MHAAGRPRHQPEEVQASGECGQQHHLTLPACRTQDPYFFLRNCSKPFLANVVLSHPEPAPLILGSPFLPLNTLEFYRNTSHKSVWSAHWRLPARSGGVSSLPVGHEPSLINGRQPKQGKKPALL